MYKRKILVAVTGMSPQIITETLFALYQKNWLPEEIFVLTTAIGRQQITRNLLDNHGFFHRFCEEYSVSGIKFNEENIRVITDQNGGELADIRTPEENNLAADQIVRFIHSLCEQEDTELHVSIAGGRKSMGFYIGYALSLFGRSQDRLSHVLVEEAFEQSREFYYSSKEDKFLNTPMGMRNAAEAKIMLAEIPFVRMREHLDTPQLSRDWNYLDAVELTQRSLQYFDLYIDIEECSIHCGGVSFKLQPQDFAIYAALADFKQKEPERLLSLGRDTKDDAVFAERTLYFLKQIKKTLRAESSQEAQEKLEQLQNEGRAKVQEFNSRLKKQLKEKLQGRAALFLIESVGKNNNKSYRLATNSKLIHIIGLKQ